MVPAHVEVAARRPAVTRRAAPATAAKHAVRVRGRPRRIVRRRLRIVPVIIPILARLCTFPCMSYSPQAFGFFSPTGCVFFSELA